MPVETNTLTVINALPPATGITPASQLMINVSSANNTLSRVQLVDLTAYLFPEGPLISNAGGTAAALDISSNFTISSAGTDGNSTLALSPLSEGLVSSNGTILVPTELAGPASWANGTLTISAAAVPATGPIYSNGTALGVMSLVGLSFGSGTLTATGVATPAAGLVSSNGTVLAPTALVGPVSWANDTLTVSAAAVPGAGVVYSDGTALHDLTLVGATYSGGTMTVTGGGTGTVTEVVAAGLLSGGTITTSGTISFLAPSAGVLYSNGTTLGPATLVGLSYSAGTLSVTGGSGITLESSGSTLTEVGTVLVSGGVVTGSSGTTVGLGSGTITITGGGAGQPGPIFGTTTTFTRPALSAFGTLYRASDSILEEWTGGPIGMAGASTPDDWTVLTIPAPSGSGTYTVTALVEPQLALPGFPEVGLILANAVGNFLHFGFFGNSSTPQLTVNYWTNGNTFSGTTVGTSTISGVMPLWLRLVVTPTLVACQISANGLIFTDIDILNFNPVSTVGIITQIGFGADLTGSGANQQPAGYLWHFVAA